MVAVLKEISDHGRRRVRRSASISSPTPGARVELDMIAAFPPGSEREIDGIAHAACALVTGSSGGLGYARPRVLRRPDTIFVLAWHR